MSFVAHMMAGASLALVVVGISGCATCTEQVSLGVTNASAQAVRVVISPMDDDRLELIDTVLPPGGELSRDQFQVRCGMGPKMTASTLGKSPVTIETSFSHERGSVRIIGTPAGGLGIEVDDAKAAASHGEADR